MKASCIKKLRADDSYIPSSELVCTAACSSAAGTSKDHLSDLSLEVLCHILKYLPLRELACIELMSQKLRTAVSMHLRLARIIDLSENGGSSAGIFSWMPAHMTDRVLDSLIARCPDLELVRGLHPRNGQLTRYWSRGGKSLSVAGIVAALRMAYRLQGVETSSVELLEAILTDLPRIQIIGPFKNRDYVFPSQHTVSLTANPRLTHLFLTGVSLHGLPCMDYVRHVQLRWVTFTDEDPFATFSALALRTFVLSMCMKNELMHGGQQYQKLLNALSSARSLSRLELVHVPLTGKLLSLYIVKHCSFDSMAVALSL
jgi:F-box protein 38